jgi:uncharacterized iron-regulated membrane protein
MQTNPPSPNTTPPDAAPPDTVPPVATPPGVAPSDAAPKPANGNAAAARARRFRVLLHRYAGLTMAACLFMAGLTGSILAYRHEIDAWLNSALAHTGSRGAQLPPQAMIDAVEKAYPNVRVTLVPLKIDTGNSAEIRVESRYDSASKTPRTLAFDRVYLDPVTGRVLGTRGTRTTGISRENIMQLTADLHSKILLGGNGRIFMGIIALIWVFDSFVSLSLTLPPARPFFSRWRRQWTMKLSGPSVRSALNWHRVIGLWLWIILLPLAISSVYMNFPSGFVSAVATLSKPAPSAFLTRHPVPEKRDIEPALGYREILARAEKDATARGIKKTPGLIFYNSYYRLYGLMYRPTQNHRGAGLGDPFLCYDADTGELVSATIPGDGNLGDHVIALQRQIHSGDIGGPLGRAAVSATGILIAVMSVTGPLIWWKKQRLRRTTQRGIAATKGTDSNQQSGSNQQSNCHKKQTTKLTTDYTARHSRNQRRMTAAGYAKGF